MQHSNRFTSSSGSSTRVRRLFSANRSTSLHGFSLISRRLIARVKILDRHAPHSVDAGWSALRLAFCLGSGLLVKELLDQFQVNFFKSPIAEERLQGRDVI